MDILKIANKIKDNGGNLYLVGGAVRDELLGLKSHDADYCVTGLNFDEFQSLFPEAFARGKSFAVFDMYGCEFAIARRERKISTGHRGFDIEANKSVTIEEDLARRDITINAIARDVLTGEIIDKYGGISDIENKIIRATTEHFKEDPLRVYRVARFSAKFGFEVEDGTIKMMNELKDELPTISVERVYTEFSNALLTDKPSIFFNVLKSANVLDVHFKEVCNLIGAEQPFQYHPEGDAYNHTMEVIDRAVELTRGSENERKLEIMFGALAHDFGKGETPKEEYPHHHGHDERGKDIVQRFGQRLKLPNRLIKCGQTSAVEHMTGGRFYEMTPAKKVSFIERVDKSILGLDGLQCIVYADKKHANNFEKIGRECLDTINGEYIIKNFGIEKNSANFGQVLHEKRVEWMKGNEILYGFKN